MAYWIVKVILTPVLRLLYRVEVTGRRQVPRRGPVILASNHQSFIDSLFLPLVVGRRVTFVAKAEYFENPKTAWFFRSVGQIPIKRGSGDAAVRALASAREVLDAGGVLGIYPEGTRSPDGRLYRGRTGVARLALATGACVVPVAIAGTAEVQPIDCMRPRVGKRVGIRFGAPLHFGPEEAGRDDPDTARRVTERIMEAVADLSGQVRVDRYATRADREAAADRRARREPATATVDLGGPDHDVAVPPAAG